MQAKASVTNILLFSNVILFFLSPSKSQYAFVSKVFMENPLVELPKLITHLFLHSGIRHLLLNMFNLQIFGPDVENDMGWMSYLILYLASGIGGTLAYAFFKPESNALVLGASGAISGVMGAYYVLHEESTRKIRNFVMSELVGLLLLKGNVNYVAHLGGFFIGYLIFRMQRR